MSKFQLAVSNLSMTTNTSKISYFFKNLKYEYWRPMLRIKANSYICVVDFQTTNHLQFRASVLPSRLPWTSLFVKKVSLQKSFGLLSMNHFCGPLMEIVAVWLHLLFQYKWASTMPLGWLYYQYGAVQWWYLYLFTFKLESETLKLWKSSRFYSVNQFYW